MPDSIMSIVPFDELVTLSLNFSSSVPFISLPLPMPDSEDDNGTYVHLSISETLVYYHTLQAVVCESVKSGIN